MSVCSKNPATDPPPHHHHHHHHTHTHKAILIFVLDFSEVQSPECCTWGIMPLYGRFTSTHLCAPQWTDEYCHLLARATKGSLLLIIFLLHNEFMSCPNGSRKDRHYVRLVNSDHVTNKMDWGEGGIHFLSTNVRDCPTTGADFYATKSFNVTIDLAYQTHGQCNILHISAFSLALSGLDTYYCTACLLLFACRLELHITVQIPCLPNVVSLVKATAVMYRG